MKTKIIKRLLSGAMALTLTCTGLTAQGSSIEYEDEFQGGVDYETYLTWGIDDFANSTKNVYKLQYPDQSDIINSIVDSIVETEEFIAIFEEQGRKAFEIVEDSLRSALECGISLLGYDEETYFSNYTITPIKQESTAKNAAAATLMALQGSGISGYTQTSIYNTFQNDSSSPDTIHKITNLLDNEISSTTYYSVKTLAFAPINDSADNLIDCISNALISDTVPVIQFKNQVLNNGSNSMRYLVPTCVDTVAETVTFYDPDPNYSSQRSFYYYELDELLTESGVIWVSAYSSNRNSAGLAAVMAEYPEGSYYNNTGVPCTCHYDNSIDCKKDICDCEKFDWGVQCFGFAKYVFFNVKGRKESASCDEGYKVTFYENLTKTSAKTYLKNLSMGTHLRVETADGTTHSLAFISANNNNITIGQANYGSECIVSYRTYTWSDFVSRFPYLKYYVD